MRAWQVRASLVFVACMGLSSTPGTALGSTPDLWRRAFAPAPAASPTTAAPPPSASPPAAGSPPATTPPTRPATTRPTSPTPARPAPAAATQPTAPAAEAGTPDVRQSEIYGERLDGLQAEVDALKDKIFRSKARLTLLKETVLRGVLAGSRVIFAHRNLMGSGFKLVRMVYLLDGAQIFARSDETGSLDAEDELVIFDGNIAPGPHELTIELKYKGHGYGVFSYLTTLTFDSDGSHSFTAPEGGAIKLLSVGFESGNLTTEMKDRPALSWQEVPLDPSGRPLPKRRARKPND